MSQFVACRIYFLFLLLYFISTGARVTLMLDMVCLGSLLSMMIIIYCIDIFKNLFHCVRYIPLYDIRKKQLSYWSQWNKFFKMIYI
jgi:hypothetical protein